ncbi:MAG: hypothetical protein GYB65_03795 [Chloroflexi bacterium]|nr:hypothetical protein [Chloroflexota bacterium]
MPTRTLTLLLADLVGSSAHVTAIPQEEAVDFLQDALLPIQQAIETHAGTVIKFMGDGYLASFESVCHALRAAERIRQDFLRQQNTPTGITLDGVRVVVNTADVTIEDGDVLGDGVVLLSRLEKTVPTNQVYVTRVVRDIADEAEFAFDPIGELQPRGWPEPVMIYQLTSVEASYLDPDVFLIITDLHGLVPYSEELSASGIHQWLLAWGDLHRQAVAGLNGRVRQFIADMALLTCSSADDAVHTILNLQALAALHNQTRLDLPPLHFKTVLATGDLILSPTGVVGPLVNRTFDLLNITPRSAVVLEPGVYELLHAYQDRFELVTLTAADGSATRNAYQLVQ